MGDDMSDQTNVPEALRSIAAWLEQNPDIRVMFTIVRLIANTRKDMERIAVALGDGVRETANEWDASLEFVALDPPRVTVKASVPLTALDAECRVEWDYEPILKTGDER